MPCAMCGRTARQEWLVFSFLPKSREFVCSFCREAHFPGKNRLDVVRPAARSIASLGIVLMVLMLLAWVSWFAEVFVDAVYEEMNGPEPIPIENATAGEDARFYGRMNSSEEWIIFTAEDEFLIASPA